MKKALLLFTFLFCAFSMNAELRIGPMAGLNIATLHGTTLTVDSRAGWHGGLFLDLGFGKHFSIQPAAVYSMKGFKYDYHTTTTSTVPDTSGGTVSSVVNLSANVKASLGYLDIPVFLTLYSGDHKGLMIQAGPQLSFLISDNAEVSTSATVSLNGGTPQPAATVPSNKLEFTKTDIALVGGIGYKLPKSLMIYARASTGFAKVQDGEWVKSEDAGNNFVILVGAALVFGSK